MVAEFIFVDAKRAAWEGRCMVFAPLQPAAGETKDEKHKETRKGHASSSFLHAFEHHADLKLFMFEGFGPFLYALLGVKVCMLRQNFSVGLDRTQRHSSCRTCR